MLHSDIDLSPWPGHKGMVLRINITKGTRNGLSTGFRTCVAYRIWSASELPQVQDCTNHFVRYSHVRSAAAQPLSNIDNMAKGKLA